MRFMGTCKLAKDSIFLQADSDDADQADAQDDLSLRWAYMSFYWFCHMLRLMCYCVKNDF